MLKIRILNITGEKLDLKNVAVTIETFPKNPITPHAIAQECSIDDPRDKRYANSPSLAVKKFATVASRPSMKLAIWIILFGEMSA